MGQRDGQKGPARNITQMRDVCAWGQEGRRIEFGVYLKDRANSICSLIGHAL